MLPVILDSGCLLLLIAAFSLLAAPRIEEPLPSYSSLDLPETTGEEWTPCGL